MIECMVPDLTLPAWHDLNPAQAQRWTRVMDTLTTALHDTSVVIVDSHQPATATGFADRLALAAHQRGRHCLRLTANRPAADEDTWHAERTAGSLAVADGSLWRGRHADQAGAVIWLRTPTAPGAPGGHRDDGASIVVDLHDPAWPVIRHIHPDLAAHDWWYRTESQAFFGIRAATWDTRFGDDIPVYTAAIAEASIKPGGVAIDLGCGTGRALPALSGAVGPAGTVIGIDHTREMLDVARSGGRAHTAALIQADACHLPLRDGCADAIFAAGLITHLPDIHAGLRELARVTKPGGVLILFHPSGRAALAARHGRLLQPGEPLDRDPLAAAMDTTGWQLTTHDDPPHRFLAIAVRQ